uniref:Uncharacterized protein n=1 Tax=Manihot esculenta TaxID=3983 RepID=A0A2C9V4Y7_MANES
MKPKTELESKLNRFGFIFWLEQICAHHIYIFQCNVNLCMKIKLFFSLIFFPVIGFCPGQKLNKFNYKCIQQSTS